MGALDDHLAALGALPREEAQDVIAKAQKQTRHMRWVPNPGPQTTAYFSDADEILFGGEAGGGKTDIVIGAALTKHQRSLILRRTQKEADKLPDRVEEIVGNRAGWNSQKGTWRIDGRIIDLGGCQLESDKKKRKGIPHDLKAFDELVDFTESQYTYIITWNRSKDPKQKCQVVATTNPPTSPEGMWVVHRWAPWLDPKHPRPAKDGELRWFTNIDGKDTEIQVVPKGEKPLSNTPWTTIDEHGKPGPVMRSGEKLTLNGKTLYPKSRTFIRSKLEDNPDLTQTDDYQNTLNALPEELRKAFAEGRFDTNLKDQAFQIIPSAWIREAQERWVPKPPPNVPMCAMAVDCSGGGDDPMVIATRYDGYYPSPIKIPGREIPADRPGKYAAGQVVSYRRNSCPVVVDMGGGYGGPIYEQLAANDIKAIPYKGAEGAVQRTADGLLKFKNTRTQTLWRFREALDPSQPGGSPISLPPSPTLMADLAAPTFKLATGGILEAEPKVTVCARLGRSTDEGDAVMMAWSAGPTYVTDGDAWREVAEQGRRMGGQRPQVVMGRSNAAPKVRRW